MPFSFSDALGGALTGFVSSGGNPFGLLLGLPAGVAGGKKPPGVDSVLPKIDADKMAADAIKDSNLGTDYARMVGAASSGANQYYGNLIASGMDSTSAARMAEAKKQEGAARVDDMMLDTESKMMTNLTAQYKPYEMQREEDRQSYQNQLNNQPNAVEKYGTAILQAGLGNIAAGGGFLGTGENLPKWMGGPTAAGVAKNVTDPNTGIISQYDSAGNLINTIKPGDKPNPALNDRDWFARALWGGTKKETLPVKEPEGFNLNNLLKIDPKTGMPTTESLDNYTTVAGKLVEAFRTKTDSNDKDLEDLYYELLKDARDPVNATTPVPAAGATTNSPTTSAEKPVNPGGTVTIGGRVFNRFLADGITANPDIVKAFDSLPKSKPVDFMSPVDRDYFDARREWETNGFIKTDSEAPKAIRVVADSNGVSATTLTNIIHQESSGNPNATNVDDKGVVHSGLGQFAPSTLSNPGYGAKPMNAGEYKTSPTRQVEATGQYLGNVKRHLQAKFKLDDKSSEVLAVASYHAGPAAVEKLVTDSLAKGKDPLAEIKRRWPKTWRYMYKIWHYKATVSPNTDDLVESLKDIWHYKADVKPTFGW